MFACHVRISAFVIVELINIGALIVMRGDALTVERAFVGDVVY